MAFTKGSSHLKTFHAIILTVGAELLSGKTLNSNALFIGKRLSSSGWLVVRQIACRDSIDEIKQCLGESLAKASLVIVSGGLGPTPDDLTRDAIARYFDSPIAFSETQFKRIETFYHSRGKTPPSLVRAEAMYPKKATPVLNDFGLAMGFYIVQNKKMVVALPGVPYEMESMFEHQVEPAIKKFFPGVKKPNALTVRTCGISEPEVMEKLGEDFFDRPFDFGIYPDIGEVCVRITASDSKVLNFCKKRIQERLGEKVYAWKEVSLAEVVSQLLMQKKKTLAAAESCTGGLFSHELTRFSGASGFFIGSIVAYQNKIKGRYLQVSNQTLKKDGAVSESCAKEMAAGIVKQFNSDYGISITGIAGPDGGTAKKPVGLVYIALSSKKEKWTEVRCFQFHGKRLQMQRRAVKKALEMIWKHLTSS